MDLLPSSIKTITKNNLRDIHEGRICSFYFEGLLVYLDSLLTVADTLSHKQLHPRPNTPFPILQFPSADTYKAKY